MYMYAIKKLIISYSHYSIYTSKLIKYTIHNLNNKQVMSIPIRFFARSPVILNLFLSFIQVVLSDDFLTHS